MLNFPSFPETLITRQVECICCRGLFTVSEDYPTRTDQRTRHWRLVPDHFIDTILRYQPNRNLRTVTPQMRAYPGLDRSQFSRWRAADPPPLINCPRCGADNRNWIAILRSPENWWRNPSFLIGMIITAALTIAAFITVRNIVSIRWNIILLLAVFLAGFIPINSSARHWRRLRDHEYTTPIAKHKSFWRRIAPPLRAGLITSGVFMFIVPFILIILIPWGFDAALRFFANEPEQPLVIQIDDLLKTLTLLPGQSTETTQKAVQDVTDSLETLLVEAGLAPSKLDNLTSEQELSIIIQMLRNMARAATEEEANVINIAVDVLIQYAAAAGLEIDSSSLPDWFPVPTSFLRSWLLYVLATSIAGIAFGWLAAAGYVRTTNRHLPRPIYHSIAGMTRVVVWEAKHALEIGDEVEKIQWTGVRRNDSGGIVLEGLHRESAAHDQPNDSPTTRVRAEHCKITSDKWGQIVEARIKSTRVLMRPRRHKEHSLGEELFDHIQPTSLEKERPSPARRT